MLSKTLKLSIVTLLVTLSLTNTNAMMCSEEMDEDACKMEFMKMMDKTYMKAHMDIMKQTMTKIMDAFNPMMKEMPADDSHTKMMRDTVSSMNSDMKMMDEMMEMTDRMKMQEMIEKFYEDMQPDFGMAHKEDSTNTEMFTEMADKHHYEIKIIEDFIDMMMTKFEDVWMELYKNLREKDMKKYPMLMTMNDMMMKMKAADNRDDKMEMMMEMMKTMTEFQETPYMMAMYKAMGKTAKKQ